MPVESSSKNAPQPLAAIRDYELLERLGQGGMGTVYRARHTQLDKPVAIKLLPRAHLRNPEMVARFKREMKSVGKLQHPNIIQAFDGGEEKGIQFLALEYAVGLDARAVLDRIGPLPVADACEIIRQAAVGLQHAHHQGLVHRDLKPANLLVAWSQAAEDGGRADDGHDDRRASASGFSQRAVVKVLDLGLALLHAEPHTQTAGLTGTGQVMGTLDYIAPEQTSDSHVVDIRADIYSLGCTLYALLAGRPPFSGAGYNTAYQKIVAHNQESPRPLHESRDLVSPEVVTVLEKMMAKNPDDRFATPADVAAALEPHCADNSLSVTLATAETRQAEHQAKTEAATQGMASSALERTATAAEDGMDAAAEDELLQLLRSTAAEETVISGGAGQLAPTEFHVKVEAAPTTRQVQRTRSRDELRRRFQLLTVAATLVIGLLVAGVIFRVVTNRGTIELTLLHPDAQVTVNGEVIRLRPGKQEHHFTIRIAPGRHKLQVEKDGYLTFSQDLEIARGEKKLVRVRLLRPKKSAASAPTTKRSAAVTHRPVPPLAAWLKARKVLTVKQDGSAAFRTIQAALDARSPVRSSKSSNGDRIKRICGT